MFDPTARRRVGVLAIGLALTAPVTGTARGATASRRCPTDFKKDAHISVPSATVIPAKKQAWENALGGPDAAQPQIQARLAGWPQFLLVDRHALPDTDREFALRVARDTWRGLDMLTDRENGLPVDNVRVRNRSVAVADAHVGDYTSGTNIGLHLIAIIAARDLGFIAETEAVAKIRTLLDTVEHLETFRGFPFNFYDTTSLERTSNFVSFVDASWLTAGLMVVRTAFPELSARCTTSIAQKDFRFFYDPAKRQISHGYYVKPGVRSPYDYGMLYTEARLGSLIAIGKGDVPEASWFEMARTFPGECSGQTQTPTHTRATTVRGHTFSAGYYEWSGLRYVPSWGGSMFEALMPTLLLDEPQYAPKSLGANDRIQATVQRRYALEALGYTVWGISPCASPVADGYGEYGVKVLGARGYDAGAVTPHAAALALSVAPAAALANLRAMAQLYDIYGEYGFYDAVDPRSGTVAYKYLTLDQSMLFIALANYLNDHCIQKRFAADPIMQKVLPIISDEDFFN
ncbi:MAG TPA: glucoamylase family protein [Candidatus Acidoferrales bacterium]|nr:glucoamylase family protein [Candidatus Acidoferrales bacterium]